MQNSNEHREDMEVSTARASYPKESFQRSHECKILTRAATYDDNISNFRGQCKELLQNTSIILE